MKRVIDLHHMTLSEAQQELKVFMDTLDKSVLEVVVIHGFHKGTTLKNFVLKFKHPKIKRKIKTMNKGETIFLCDIL